MVAEVLEFPGADLSDVPAMLRRFADDVESGAYQGAQFIVAVAAYAEEAPRVLAWGRCTSIETMGALAAAQFKLVKVES